MRASCTAVCALLLSLAQPSMAEVKGPREVAVPVGRLATVPLTVDGDESDYQILGTEVDAFREYTPDPKQIKLRVIGYQPGTAYVVVASQKGGKLQPLFTVTLTVTGTAPVPPTPPPGPTPNPPVPVPDPVNPPPIAGQGFQVLVVTEEGNATQLTEGQVAALYGKQTRAYLDTHTVKDERGNPSYRIWDQHTSMAFVDKKWADAMKRTRASVPWIVISNGTTGYEGPLPKTLTETMELLKKFGGP